MKNNLKVLFVCLMIQFIISCDKDDESITPEITGVNITGVPQEGKQLVGFYTATGFSPEDYKNLKTTVTWWIADDEKGTNTEIIPNTTSSTYIPTSDDIGKYIAVEITVNDFKNTKKKSTYIGPIAAIASETSNLTTAIDQQLFEQIKRVGDEFAKNEIWRGYDFKNLPLYLIHKNAIGEVDRAFIVNPSTNISAATAIPKPETSELKVYRYDHQSQQAFELITKNGNGLYDFDFKIDNNNYYVQIYSDAEVLKGAELSSISAGISETEARKLTFGTIDFIIHENFHTYQDSWMAKKSTFPLPKKTNNTTTLIEKIELKLLLHQIFKNFPNNALNEEQYRTKLKQYLAIRSRESEIEPDSQNIILTENGEGSARFIEKMALRKVFANRANEPFVIGTLLENNFEIGNNGLSELFEQTLYDIGASACFAIWNIDKKALDQLKENKTIFQITQELFPMTDRELAKQLQNAKEAVNWTAIQAKAITWEKIK